MMSSLTSQNLLLKNKLFEMTKGTKESIFQQKLRIEFPKSDEVFRTKIFVDPCLVSEKKMIYWYKCRWTTWYPI